MNALAVTVPIIIVGIGFLIYKWAATGFMTTEYLKLIFGYLSLILLVGLSILVIREGANLNQKAGEILSQVIGVLSVIVGSFVQWAFSFPKGGEPTNHIAEKGE